MALKVLIVDDDQQVRGSLKRLTEKHGATAIEAGDGKAGLEAALLERPDAIISDGLMPRMDGFQFLDAVRRDPALRAVPFILYSAVYSSDEERNLAASLGADALVVKPSDLEELWRKLLAAIVARSGWKAPETEAGRPALDEESLVSYCTLVASKLETKVRELEAVIADHERTKVERARIETLLRAASDEWRSTFDAMNDAIALLDRDGRILRCNKAMATLANKPFAELVGQHCCEGVLDAPGPGFFEATKRSRKRETTGLQIGARWFKATADPFFDGEGALLGAVQVLEDVTERKLSEEIIRKIAQQQKAILNNIPHMAWLKDSEGRFLAVNEPFGRACGLKPEDVTGKTDLDFWPSELADRYRDDDREVMLSGRQKIVEEPLTNVEGHTVWIETIKTPIHDEKGDVIGTTGIARDISERKRSEETLAAHSRELTALNRASNSLMLITSPGVIYQEICNIIYSVFSLKMVWLGVIVEAGYEVKPVAHCGDDNGFLSSIRVTWDDSPFGNGPTGMAIKAKTTFTATLADANTAPWKEKAELRGFRAVLSAPLVNARSECVGTLTFYSDKDDYFTPDRVSLCQVFANQAAIAIENAKLVEGLENKVLDRTRQMEDANVELQSLNRELQLRREEADTASSSKTDFLANMSHELRTPLNAIMGFSDIMLMGLAGSVSDKQKEFLGDISTSGQHLLSLITDILDLSKVEAGKVELELSELSTKELIDGSLMMFKERSLKHGIRIETSVDEALPDITADRRKLKQTLVNLLSNAFKFTPEGGSVRVAARRVQGPEESADFIEFSVADTGIGISSAHQKKLFKPFEQIETSLTKKYPGTGLGLSLCRSFVELHGGRIWVESEEGKGSTFFFTIPVHTVRGRTP